MNKANKLKFDLLKKMSFFFSSAENYWENDFSFTPKCCDKSRILDDVSDETEEKKTEKNTDILFGEKRMGSSDLTTKDCEEMNTEIADDVKGIINNKNKLGTNVTKEPHSKLSLKMKLSIREIEDIKANMVEGKRTKINTEIPDENVKESRKTVEITNENFSSAWTKEEDTMLMRLCFSKVGKKWKKISEIIATKSPTQCAYRYKKLKKTNLFNKYKDEGDILLEEEKVKEYFNSKFEHYGLENLDINDDINQIKRKKEISQQNSNQTRDQSDYNKMMSQTHSGIDDYKLSEDFLKLNKPTFKKDSNDFIEFSEIGGVFSTNKAENMFEPKENYNGINYYLLNVESNAKILKNVNEKFSNQDKENHNFKNELNFYYDHTMRKDSPNYFRVNSKKFESINSSDSDFTPNFDNKFINQSESDENMYVRESDYKLNYSKYESDSEKIDNIMNNIEKFISSKEFNEPQESDFNVINLKMTSYLSDINSITGRKYANKPHTKRALELQVIILNNMVKLAQMKMNEM